MLIEFSGPAASGKTTFVRHLLCEMPDVLPVLRSVNPNRKRPVRQLWTAAKQLHYFPLAFVHAHKWYRSTCEEDRSIMEASFQMATEYCVYKAASRDSKLWLLDQGFLQFGSKLPQSAWNNPFEQAYLYQKAIWIGDGVVLISMPPELSLSRITGRGGGRLLQQTAEKRGCSSAYDFLQKNLKLQEHRIKLALSLKSSVLHLYVTEKDGVDGSLHRPEGCGERDVDYWLENIRHAFIGWWES